MIIIIVLCLEAEVLRAEELVESFICSENENPPLIDEETDKSSNSYTYLKQDIIAVNENSDKLSTLKPSTKIRAQPSINLNNTLSFIRLENNTFLFLFVSVIIFWGSKNALIFFIGIFSGRTVNLVGTSGCQKLRSTFQSLSNF